MPRGSKKSYTSKQRRQARHIEESEESRGRSSSRSKQIAYATVNKQDGGGKKSGSGRGRKSTRSTSSSRSSSSSGSSRSSGRKGARKGGRKSTRSSRS